MGKISAPHQVKLFIGMLSQDVALIEKLTNDLCNIFGTADLASPVLPWDHTRYYEKEMGERLKRQFLFFRELIDPGVIADVKVKTIGLENLHINEAGGRKINLDPGYLDAAKIVLASTKDFSHRIYLDKGIYGEVTLIYSGKDYQILPYTFPDYRTKEYWDIFREARELYKTAVK
ncbi:MAG: DUF4416 family protein, partial [Nitrospirota bacterium]